MKHYQTVFLSFLFATNLFAASTYSIEEVKRIKNDKEVLISSFNQKEKERILEKFNDQDKRNKLTSTFYEVVQSFLNDDSKHCEADFQIRLEEALSRANFNNDRESINEYLKLLRSTNAIDDILYDILTALNEDTSALRSIDLKKPFMKSLFSHKNRLEKNTLEDLYWRFKSWPDDKSACSTQEFMRMKESIIVPKDSPKLRTKYLGTLNKAAFQKNLITLETYNKLEFLRTDSNINKRNIWLNDYFKIIFNAKNRMIPVSKSYEIKDLNAESKFSSEKLKRFSNLTRRKVLYQKYNETQIILLAQVMQKASKRMGVDPDTTSSTPVIVQEFKTITANGETEISVEKIELDPQSQYNLARRLMRKDIVETQMMGIFNGVSISYNDVVMASLEVGYISLEDIEFVVKYDDLWNPETSKYDRISRFVFSLAGYGTFFLPPPWNVTASLALGIIENVVDNNNRNGAYNDNPGTFIE